MLAYSLSLPGSPRTVGPCSKTLAGTTSISVATSGWLRQIQPFISGSMVPERTHTPDREVCCGLEASAPVVFFASSAKFVHRTECVRSLLRPDSTPAGYPHCSTALDAEALIDRGKRGDVISADPVGIVRRWSDSYDLLKTNTAHTFITPNGARHALQSLLEAQTVAIRWGVTGSFGAVELAPVAAPALLTVYVSAPDLVARELGLLPAEQGVDVVLLSPYDEVVWDRMTNRNGISIVAPPQLAVDCLTGTGRMPAEGEAVLTWMAEREDEWRIPSLAQLTGASS